MRNVVAAGIAVAMLPIGLRAQTPQPPPAPERADPDVLIDALQPDFTLAALPTGLRMPRGKWAFRVTHRFTRPLGRGNFGDLLADAFGFDSGAQIGLEVRYGLRPGTQVGVHRTSNRDIQFFGQHNFMNERDGAPVGVDLLVTLEGRDNLQEQHQSAIGAIVTRKVGGRAALYAEPILVVNTSPLEVGDQHTLMLGLGARLRVRPAMYLVGEFTPRLAGYDPGVHQISVGIEGRSGGHLFHVSVSNGFGTTLGQVARGGLTNDDWYIGFNISRKFF